MYDRPSLRKLSAVSCTETGLYRRLPRQHEFSQLTPGNPQQKKEQDRACL
jgi:hypothetical protein